MLRHSSQDSETSSRKGAAQRLLLKQRTTSIDNRKDFTAQTWWSLRDLIKTREYWITVDHSSLWKRHVCWALTEGADLRGYLTSRFASSMVFMSLLLGAELSVLFNSAGITTDIRKSLKDEDIHTLKFWIGILVLISIICSIFSLIATFTAWGMVSAVSNENAHCILRSSIGLYVTALPGRFIVNAIYSFLMWFVLLIMLLLPIGFWSIMLVVSVVLIFIHIMIVFSTFGRLIMHTGCMGKDRIFHEDFERNLLPRTLQGNLYTKAKAELANNTSVTRQYRRKVPPLDHEMSIEDMSKALRQLPVVTPDPLPNKTHRRKRTDSIVRFADNCWLSSDLQGEQNENEDDGNPIKYSRSPPLAKLYERTSSLHSNDSVSSSQQPPPSESTAESRKDSDTAVSNHSTAFRSKPPLHETLVDSPLASPFSISTLETPSFVVSCTPLTEDEKFDLEYGQLFGGGGGGYSMTDNQGVAEEQDRLLTSNDIVKGHHANYGASR